MNKTITALNLHKVTFQSCRNNLKYSKMSSAVGISEEKRKLRLLMSHKLNELSETDKIRQTYIVSRMLFNYDKFQEAKRIAVYVSMKNEIGTYDVLQKALEIGKFVYIPLTVGKNMKMVRLKSFDELKSMPKTKWNIIQPLESDNREDCLQTGGAELVVVPGVAFTSTGLRLGHGRGFYDRFLQENHQVLGSDCTTVGLALNEQIVDAVPTTERDYKLSQVFYAACSSDKDLPADMPSPPQPFSI